MNPTELEIETVSADRAEQARVIRLRLPRQAVTERVEMARLSYAPLYTMGLVRQRVAETLPHRVGYVRSSRLEPIEEYTGAIPDEALIKYDEARRSGLFARFWVVTPAYYWRSQIDPWIVAEVAGSTLCAVIARWDDAPEGP